MWKKSEWKKQLAASVPAGLKAGLKVGVVKGEAQNLHIPAVGVGKGKAEEETRRPDKVK